MKKLFVILAMLFASATALEAQNYMVVDSEKIFKSITEYNSALTQIDALSTAYQEKVDAKFEEVETLYNTWVAKQNYVTAAQNTAYKNEILEKEAIANEFQESIFSNDGILMKRRVELIAPIQEKVFTAIENYAKANGFDLVIDLASNATILYKSAAVDRTDAVINYLK